MQPFASSPGHNHSQNGHPLSSSWCRACSMRSLVLTVLGPIAGSVLEFGLRRIRRAQSAAQRCSDYPQLATGWQEIRVRPLSSPRSHFGERVWVRGTFEPWLAILELRRPLGRPLPL